MSPPHAILPSPVVTVDAATSFANEVSRLTGLGDLLMSSDLMSQAAITAANGSGVDEAAQEVQGSAVLLSPRNPLTNPDSVPNGGLNGGFPLLRGTLGRDYSTITANGGYGAVPHIWELDETDIPIYEAANQARYVGKDVRAKYPVDNGWYCLRTDTYRPQGKNYITASVLDGSDTLITLGGNIVPNVTNPVELRSYTPRLSWPDPGREMYSPAFEGGSYQGTHLPLHNRLGSSNNSIGGGDTFQWATRNVNAIGIRYEMRMDDESYYAVFSTSSSRKMFRISGGKEGGFLEDRYMDVRCAEFSATNFQMFPVYAYGPGYDMPHYDGAQVFFDIPYATLRNVWLRYTINMFYDYITFDVRRADTGEILKQETKFASTFTRTDGEPRPYCCFLRRAVAIPFTNGNIPIGVDDRLRAPRYIEGRVSGASGYTNREWQNAHLDSGDWSAGTAALSQLWLQQKSGTFSSGEQVDIYEYDGGPILTGATFTVTNDTGPQVNQNYISSAAFNQHSSSISVDDPNEPEWRDHGVRYCIISADTPVLPN